MAIFRQLTLDSFRRRPFLLCLSLHGWVLHALLNYGNIRHFSRNKFITISIQMTVITPIDKRLYSSRFANHLPCYTANRQSENAMEQPLPDHILQVGLGFWASKTLLSAVEMELFTE